MSKKATSITLTDHDKYLIPYRHKGQCEGFTVKYVISVYIHIYALTLIVHFLF